MTNIKGKVAKILNSRELVINRGSNDGVTEGMIFNILDPSGEDIKDPDTGKPLGSLKRTKLQVRVNAVHENLAVAITYKKTTHVIGRVAFPAQQPFDKQFPGLADLLNYRRTVVTEETLKKPDGVYDPIDEADSFVKIGDIAESVQVEDNE